jgi:hypothetical protein
MLSVDRIADAIEGLPPETLRWLIDGLNGSRIAGL